MKNVLISIFLVGLAGCSDAEYYKVQFEYVARLAEGDKVFIKGLEVGEVKDLMIDGQKKVLATIWVGRNIKLTSGSIFTIRSEMFGQKYIEIDLSDSEQIMNPDAVQHGYVEPPALMDCRKLTRQEMDSIIKANPGIEIVDLMMNVLDKLNKDKEGRE